MNVAEIIIVDDCSPDNTQEVIREFINHDARIVYLRQNQNEGHLAALRLGIQKSTSDWIALLDADDELTPNSLACRVDAALRFQESQGVLPQLIYGDHSTGAFARLSGYSYPFLCKELSLCQTSTIMIGRACIPYFPKSSNVWNTDDEIVLAIGKHFPILHSGEVVAIYHNHQSATKMSNSPKRVFRGVRQLVSDHRSDILRIHGIRRLILWYLRVVKAFLACQLTLIEIRRSDSTWSIAKIWWRICCKSIQIPHGVLSAYLHRHFELSYF